MKVIFDRKQLLGAVTPLLGCVSNKNTFAAIAGILVSTDRENGNCILAAYDLEKGMRTVLPCQVEEDGAYVLNANKFVQVIRSMEDDSISVSVDPKTNQTTVVSGAASFVFGAQNGEEFPILPTLEGDRGIKVRKTDFRDIVTKTSFAIAVNDARASLNGAYFHVEDNRFTVVGCDGNRLSRAVVELDVEYTLDTTHFDQEFIIPGKTMSELLSIVEDSEDYMEMQLTYKHVFFKFDNTDFFSRLIDQPYVEYQRFIPKTNKIFAYIDTAALNGAVNRALLVTEDKVSGQSKSPVRLKFTDGTLTVSSASVVSRISDDIPVRKEGEDIEIGFNCRLLLDALKVCDCGELKISLNSPYMSMIIEPAEETPGKEFLMLVLPVRLNG
ncbi:MAG: DNA polymerase III subunit beta [Lachnospiraceae bacterium]|nr:DNA polymerase III subunit beta [Lachnospiraceae bacterium]